MRIITLLLLVLFITGPAFSVQSSRDLYNLGLEAFKTGSYSSSELLFRKVLDKDDSYRDRSWFYLSRSIYEQGKYKSAIFEFNSFLTKCRTEILRIESRYWMGESYYKLDEKIKAIEEYKRFVSRSKNSLLNVEAFDRIGSIYYNEKRFNEAIIEFERAIKISNDRNRNARIIYKIGLSYFGNRDNEAAKKRIIPLIYSRIDNKTKTRLRILLGRIYQNENNHKKAITTFNSIPVRNIRSNSFYDLYYHRAISYHELKEYRRARSDLEIFSSLASGSKLYYRGVFLLGNIQLKLNKPDLSIELFSRVWEKARVRELRFESSLILSELLMDKDPGKVISIVSEFFPGNDPVKKKKVTLILARANLKVRNYEKASGLLDIYIKENQFDDRLDEVYFLKARIFLEKNDVENAAIYFNKIKQENPFSKYIKESDYYLALLNYKKGKFTDSLKLLKKYSRNRNNKFHADSIMLMLDIQIQEKLWKEAERSVQTLIRYYKDHSDIDSYIFKYARELYPVERKKALYYFNRILYLFPRSESAMKVIRFNGDIEYESKRYKNAIKFYEKFLNSEIKEDRGDTFFRLLESYYRTGKYEKVITLIKKGDLPPLNENQWMELPLLHARSYYKINNHTEVYSILKWEDVSGFEDADVEMFIVSTINTGDLERVKQVLDEISGREELFIKSVELLVDQYKETGKLEEALFYIDETVLTKKISKSNYEKILLEAINIKISIGELSEVKKSLSLISLKKYQPHKDALETLFMFKSGQKDRGFNNFEKKRRNIFKSKYKDSVSELVIDFCFEKNRLGKFLEYGKYFGKKNDNKYIFLSGKIFFRNSNYKQSFYNFYRLTNKKDSQYYIESNYYLGIINLSYYKRKNSAIKYLVNSSMASENQLIYVNSKLELARIYFEKRNLKRSGKILNEIINSSVSKKYIIMAKNLKAYYKLP